jgi:hypothetical protein
MESWFSGVSFPFPIPVEVDVNTDGASASWGPPIQLNSSMEDAGYLRMLLIAEVTEMFMMSQAGGWFPSNEGSNGEGLSRFRQAHPPSWTFTSTCRPAARRSRHRTPGRVGCENSVHAASRYAWISPPR